MSEAVAGAPSAAGHVRTVRGDVAAAALGFTSSHEHLVTSPGASFRGGDDDLLLDDPVAAAVELTRFAAAGGRAVVEVSTEEFGRDAAALARLSLRSGVHIVAATGHVCEAQWAGVVDVGARSDAELEAEFERDLLEGFPGTFPASGAHGDDLPVRAGVIKVGSSEGTASATERRVLAAAARVQRRTGAPIVTHTTKGTAAVEQAELLLAAGADPAHVQIGHQDLRLDRATHRELLALGVTIAFDGCGKERHAPDQQRIDHLLALIEEGHGAQLVLGGDMARRSDWTAFGGGPGLPHLPWRIVPWLISAGASEPAARALVVENPARLLAWAPPRER